MAQAIVVQCFRVFNPLYFRAISLRSNRSDAENLKLRYRSSVLRLIVAVVIVIVVIVTVVIVTIVMDI
jgi:hypothetical protein